MNKQGFPLQSKVFFVTSSNGFRGGWVEIRCTKTKRILKMKSYKTLEERQDIIDTVTNAIIEREFNLELKREKAA